MPWIRFAHAGAVTFVQRFGDALNLNMHFHVLALDGVFDADDPGEIQFVSLDPPSGTEILRVARGFARRLARLMERRGLGAESHADDADPLLRDQPLMAELCGASVRGRVATGPRAGQRVRRLGDRVEIEHLLDSTPPGCASVVGISVHAAVAVPARSETPCMHGNTSHGNREIPRPPTTMGVVGRIGKSKDVRR